MSQQTQQVKEQTRKWLFSLGKQHPRLAVLGKLFTPRIVEEVTNQVLISLGYLDKVTYIHAYGGDWPEYHEVSYKGLSQQDLYLLVTIQKNCCAICKQSGTTIFVQGGPRRLSLDYRNSVGEVRGLLCKRCITRIKVTTTLTQAEQDYLEENPPVLTLSTRITR